MAHIILVFSLSACLLLVGCDYQTKRSAPTSEEKTSTTVPVRQEPVATIEGYIRDQDSPLWKSSTKLLPNQESLTSIQFLDQKNGWIATQGGSVYRTVDGGDKWERIKPPIPKEAYISSLFFTSISNGWITCGLNASDALEFRGNKAWVFRTKDGGQNWSLQYANEAVQLVRIRFSNEQEGWAVGRQFMMRDTLQTVPFLIRTTDEGERWVDVSGNLPEAGSSNGVTDVFAYSPSDATLLTMTGELFRTVDGGRDWQQLVALGDEPEQTYMGRLVKLPTGALLAVGGADSLEGLWGVLTRHEPDGSFRKYTVNCYISDLLSISETDLLVAGHVIRPESEFTISRRQGVILHSSDAGQTWSIVYRGTAPQINALTSSDSSAIWAVGERGLVLKLKMPVLATVRRN